MKKQGSSETTYKTTRCYNSDDLNLVFSVISTSRPVVYSAHSDERKAQKLLLDQIWNRHKGSSCSTEITVRFPMSTRAHFQFLFFILLVTWRFTHGTQYAASITYLSGSAAFYVSLRHIEDSNMSQKKEKRMKEEDRWVKHQRECKRKTKSE